MSLHTHAQHLTVLAFINHEANQKCPIIIKCKLSKSKLFFLLLLLFKNMKPAAKSSVMCCIFRKWSWWEGRSEGIIYICREEFKKTWILATAVIRTFFSYKTLS